MSSPSNSLEHHLECGSWTNPLSRIRRLGIGVAMNSNLNWYNLIRRVLNIEASHYLPEHRAAAYGIPAASGWRWRSRRRRTWSRWWTRETCSDTIAVAEWWTVDRSAAASSLDCLLVWPWRSWNRSWGMARIWEAAERANARSRAARPGKASATRAYSSRRCRARPRSAGRDSARGRCRWHRAPAAQSPVWPVYRRRRGSPTSGSTWDHRDAAATTRHGKASRDGRCWISSSADSMACPRSSRNPRSRSPAAATWRRCNGRRRLRLRLLPLSAHHHRALFSPHSTAFLHPPRPPLRERSTDRS